MAGYSQQTQSRVETMFHNMVRTTRDPQARLALVYDAITWGIAPRADHVERKARTVTFIEQLLAYAEEKHRSAH